MKKPIVFIALGIVALAASLQAVVPRKWELRTREDFLKGKFDGISVSAEGTLALAPKEERIPAPVEEFYLSVLAAADGVSFLGTGHGGKVYRIGRDGQSELWFQAPEMDVTRLAQDRRGVLFAATSPNGKIYKITAKGQGEEFFNPSEKYIWDLMFMDSGELWAAVGESGGVYRISPQGEGQLFFKAEENHILCLKKTARGDVVAGSGGNGLVYRISAEGRASVLFETPFEEVRSLALDREGSIYAAASGTPSRARKEDPSPAPVRADAEVTVTVSARAAEDRPAAPSVRNDGGALFRIAADGMTTRLWSSDEEMIYSVLWKEAENQVIFGTGGRGRIYALDREDRVSLLLQQSSEQVYELVPVDSRVYVLSNNPCYFGQLLTEQRFSGEYLSQVLDARTLAAWGRLSWDAVTGAGATVQLQTRSGNTAEPNSTWSDWSPLYQKNDEPVLSPKARFLQLKVLLRTQTGKVTPVVDTLTLFYLQSNIAPSVTRLEFLKPNEVFLKLPQQEDVILGVERNLPERPAKTDDLRISFPARRAERQGFRTVVWEASDENEDTLSYTLSLRKDGETQWRTLEEDWAETLYAFDTLSFPDGVYFLRLTASDSPSNPPGLELRSDRTSPPLVIDNSLPVVKDFKAVRSGGSLEVSFTAEDAASSIEEVRFMVRPGPWRVVFPTDGIADSRSETFKFTVKLPSGADNMIAVRIRDSFGNVGVHRQVF
ncbi:MAG: hypothetical protein FJY79_05480 [Candidatus Aminicenantes bacterium]|nr:hypothetical protein [Candidatus Aminicenantes bacterium]